MKSCSKRKRSRTWSAAGSKGLKSGKTRERGHFASSQVNKIFILLTNVSKFIAALPGGSSASQGSFQRRTICASLLFSMGGLFFLSYHAPEGPVNGKPQVRSGDKTAPAARPVSVGAVRRAALTHCPQCAQPAATVDSIWVRSFLSNPVPTPDGCLQPLVRPIFVRSLSLPGKTCYNFKGHNGIDRGNFP